MKRRLSGRTSLIKASTPTRMELPIPRCQFLFSTTTAFADLSARLIF